MRKKRCLLLLAVIIVIAAVLLIALFFFLNRRPQYPFEPMPDLQQIEPPEGAQLLIFPIDSGVITAGYRDPTYLEKNRFAHYGTDFTSANGGQADVLALGDGIVLGTEFCDNSLGYIAVIRYDNTFIPQTGETISLIARYYHMVSLSAEKGGAVSAGQIIGTIDGGHKWYHHVHLELDADLEYPFHTPQVAEATSELLIRHPANGEKTLEPISVLAAGNGQRISVHPNSDCCTEKDEPKFAVKR